MQHMLRDTRIGLRLLWNRPGFTAVAVITIALGIGATTAIFSVVYATFFEPLPYRDADRLVMVWVERDGNRSVSSARDYLEWKRRATAFEDLNAWSWSTASASLGERPEQVQIAPATPGFLPMLGYGHPLALGRDFLEEEATPGHDQVVILTHRVWRERFGRDPSIIGRTIRIDRRPYTVVGVLGEGPPDENQSQLWVPLGLRPDQMNDGSARLLVMGRLKPNVSLQQANANLAAVHAHLPTLEPAGLPPGAPSVEPFRNNFLGEDTKRGLWLLLGAVVFVLLIACANVANLLLARGTVRQRELAVRASLGASRGRIVRQLLAESIALSILGGIGGVALAFGLLEIVVALMPPYMLPTEAKVRLNFPVLGFTLLACGFSGILFGAAPAWQASRTNLNDVLKATGRAAGAGTHRLRHLLVAIEFALALTLLTGGGLAVHALVKLAQRDLGFRPDHVLTFSLPVGDDRFRDSQEIARFYDQLLQRVSALPGVLSVSAGTGIPLRKGAGVLPFSIAGRPHDDRAGRDMVTLTLVTPEYFETFRIPIRRGRVFRDEDRDGAVRVAIVNETFARRYLDDADPLTQRVLFPLVIPGVVTWGAPVEWQIVGIQADVLSTSPAGEAIPEIVLPFWQSPWPYVSVAVRTAVDAPSVHRSIADIVHGIDPDLPMADVKTMEQIVSESFVKDRFNTVLFGSFAVVGLLLAVFGVYGVMSFVVAQRTHEIGVRMALGADRLRILRTVLREGLITTVAGTAAGGLGAFWVARAMRGVVAGMSAVDPTAVIAVTATLLGAALVACLVPAVRAASVHPGVALREE